MIIIIIDIVHSEMRLLLSHCVIMNYYYSTGVINDLSKTRLASVTFYTITIPNELTRGEGNSRLQKQNLFIFDENG